VTSQIAGGRDEGRQERYALADKYAKEAMEAERERRKYEAGGAEGRVTPAFVLGAQRYPRFSWMKSKRRARLDAEYREAAELVQKLDRLTGLEER
jgi:hypothetical protein